MTTKGRDKGGHWRQWPITGQQVVWPPKNHTLERERRESLTKRSLANVRDAHQKALATVVALEEEMTQPAPHPEQTRG